ncbi:hypothetical protein [Streptomyces sp. CH-036]|uniref:hypothetical protein n=1 Tax=Streptomyces sp. CH-036 TaxID=3406733 RepID=UPI003C738CD3
MATVRYLVGDPPVKSSVNLDHREQRNRTAQIAVISQDLSGDHVRSQMAMAAGVTVPRKT